MTEAEVRFASEELRQVVQTCPTGSWQLRAISKILLQMIATGVPTIIEAAEPSKEKATPRGRK